MPIGHLVRVFLGPFFSPWFVLFELLLLVPGPAPRRRLLGRLAGQARGDSRDRRSPSCSSWRPCWSFSGCITASPLSRCSSGWRFSARSSTWSSPGVVGTSGRTRSAPAGCETQRLRTRNYLSYDLGLALALAGAALGFAVIDTIGHGLQQYAARNQTYVVAFSTFLVAIAGLIPVLRAVGRLGCGRGEAEARPRRLPRAIKKQVIGGLLAVTLFTIPLVFYSFASHAAYQGGSMLVSGAGRDAAGLGDLVHSHAPQGDHRRESLVAVPGLRRSTRPHLPGCIQPGPTTSRRGQRHGGHPRRRRDFDRRLSASRGRGTDPSDQHDRRTRQSISARCAAIAAGRARTWR